MRKTFFTLGCMICIAGIILGSVMFVIAKVPMPSRYEGVNVSLQIRNYCAWYMEGDDVFGSDCCIECKLQNKPFKYKISERTFESICECRPDRILTNETGDLDQRNMSVNR